MSSNIQSSSTEIKSTGFIRHNDIFNKISSSKYTVYRGHNNNLNQEVAIKVFPSSSDSDINVNYLNEKKHLAGLSHPNIIKVFETVDHSLSVLDRAEKQVSYISFELASYGDLFDVISKHGSMSEELARTLFHDLINATEYIHSTGIAHLDLKLENILIDKDFNLKVIDFDLSQSLDSKILASKGTSGYRAPEIKKGFCYNLSAADIYSLGVILFIMFNGNPPYAEIERGMSQEFDAFYKLMRKNNSRFWEIHSQYKNVGASYFSEDFKNLVNSMLMEESRQRATIEEIKSSKWFQGPVLDKESYQEQMRSYMQKTI